MVAVTDTYGKWTHFILQFKQLWFKDQYPKLCLDLTYGCEFPHAQSLGQNVRRNISHGINETWEMFKPCSVRVDFSCVSALLTTGIKYCQWHLFYLHYKLNFQDKFLWAYPLLKIQAVPILKSLDKCKWIFIIQDKTNKQTKKPRWSLKGYS